MTEESIRLPATTIEAVVIAAKADAALSTGTMEELREWLSDQLTKSIRRLGKQPLSKRDVEALDNAYRRFSATIDRLQDRTFPPPRIPTSNGTTAWDDWRALYDEFGYNRGRRESTDWLLIGALLGLYETISGKSASAAQPRGPTMRFLTAALSALGKHVHADHGSNFQPPTVEALRKKLDGLNRASLWQAKRRLTKIIAKTG